MIRNWLKHLWSKPFDYFYGQTQVFVMCPLNAALLPRDTLARLFDKLVGVEGIMLDVWWSLCEPTPGSFDFSSYRPIFQMAIERNLKIQAVLSFHTCGESEGDQVVISLPPFIRQLQPQYPFLFYTDEDGEWSWECLSLSADHAKVFPGAQGVCLRTALDMYEDFMRAFYEQFSSWIGTHIVQIQVSMGPSGELRYPSFALSRWKFPGMGAFQCYDERMQQDYRDYIAAITTTTRNHHHVTDSFHRREKEEEVVVFPCYQTCGRGYNMLPWQTPFFGEGIAETQRGKTFLEWYSSKLLCHGEDMLERARRVFHSQVEIACKVAGIHWLYKTKHRAAEAIAGYYVSDRFHFYQRLASLLKKYGATWIFTCFEKRDEWEDKAAKCSPESLIRETWSIAASLNVPFAAENGKLGCWLFQS